MTFRAANFAKTHQNQKSESSDKKFSTYILLLIAQESVNNLSGNNASQNLPQAIAIKFIVEEQAISTHNIN